MTQPKNDNEQAQSVQIDERELYLSHAAMNNSVDAVYMADEQGRFIYVNEKACTQIGYTRQELLSMSVSDIEVDIPTIEVFENEVAPRIRSQKNVLFPGSHRRKDGTTFPVEVAATIVEYAGESIICAYARDITERIESRQLLERTTFRLEHALVNGNIGLWEWDIQSDQIEASDTLKTQLGYGVDEPWTNISDFASLIHPDDAEYARQHVERYLNREFEPYIWTRRLRTKNGTYRWILTRGTAEWDDEGKPLRMVGVHIDVSELDETNFETMSRVVPEAFYIFDLVNQKPVFENRPLHYQAVANTSSEPHHDLPILRYAHHDDHQALIDHVEKLRECPDGAVMEVEYRLRQEDGSYLSFLARDTPYRRDAKGNVQQIIGTATDVTRIRRYTEELERSSELIEKTNRQLAISNSELKQFAYVASHDLRSPLRALSNLASFIRSDDAAKLSESSQNYLQEMENRVQKMNKLIDDLLAYSRVGQSKGNLVSVNCSELVAEVVKLLDVPIGIELDVSPDLPNLQTYPVPLEQVFLNLITNAIKYHDQEVGRIEISADDRGDFVAFHVSDDGPGIDPRYQQKIFEMTQRIGHEKDVQGNGFGLAMIRKIVGSFEGEVTVQSDGTRGSTFTFTWPKQMVPQT